jgi:hypothetical protein
VRQTVLSVLTILLLALSLAALPYVGLPYTPLRVTGQQLTQYENPYSLLFLPLLAQD